MGYGNPADANVTDKAEIADRNIDVAQQLPVTPTPSTIAAAAAAAASATAPTQPEPTYQTGTGKLVGVVTLTDILGLFATSKGRKTDPLAARNQRRRSSTSTTRSSIESALSAEGIIPGGSNNGRRGSVDASSDVFRKSVSKS